MEDRCTLVRFRRTLLPCWGTGLPCGAGMDLSSRRAEERSIGKGLERVPASQRSAHRPRGAGHLP